MNPRLEQLMNSCIEYYNRAMQDGRTDNEMDNLRHLIFTLAMEWVISDDVFDQMREAFDRQQRVRMQERRADPTAWPSIPMQNMPNGYVQVHSSGIAPNSIYQRNRPVYRGSTASYTAMSAQELNEAIVRARSWFDNGNTEVNWVGDVELSRSAIPSIELPDSNTTDD